MSGQIRYSDELKTYAVAQTADRRHSVKKLAERLGLSTKPLYNWMAQFSNSEK